MYQLNLDLNILFVERVQKTLLKLEVNGSFFIEYDTFVILFFKK